MKFSAKRIPGPLGIKTDTGSQDSMFDIGVIELPLRWIDEESVGEDWYEAFTFSSMPQKLMASRFFQSTG